MEVRIDTYAEDPDGMRRMINRAYEVLVSIDEEGNKLEVPGLIVETEAQKAEWEGGLEIISKRKVSKHLKKCAMTGCFTYVSISPVRMHFWHVVTRLSRRRNFTGEIFFIGAIPELISSRLLSPFGTREKLGSRRWPFDSKNWRYFSRNSFNPVHFILFHTS